METPSEAARYAPENPRWMLLAVGMMAVHQAQSVIEEPNELAFRATTLTIAALMPLTTRLPRRVRGAVWMLVGVPPLFGAFAGHIVPIVRTQRVPPASETAPLNLAGAAFLIALGAALLRSPAEELDTPQG